MCYYACCHLASAIATRGFFSLLNDRHRVLHIHRCEPCSCDVIGSLSEVCDVTSGQCPCKNLTTSRTCRQCVEGSSNLDRANPLGCSRRMYATLVSLNVGLFGFRQTISRVCPLLNYLHSFSREFLRLVTSTMTTIGLLLQSAYKLSPALRSRKQT